MPYDGSLIFDTKINTSGFSSGLGSIGSLASAGIGSITGIFKAGADALLDFGKQVMDTGTEYEAALKQLAATMNYSVADLKDETSEAFATMQKFSDKAREQGSNTAFTAAQAVEGLNVLAMQGWGELAIKISDAALDLSSAGAISIAESASYIGAAMKGFTEETGKFGDEAATAAHYADLIAKGATIAATNVYSLGDAFSSLSSTANSFHQSSTELEVLLLRLAEQNVTGSEANTAARSLLAHIYTPLDSAQKILDEIGFSAYDENGTRPLNQTLDDLNQKIRDYAAEQAHFVDGAEKNADLIAEIQDDINKNIQARDKKEAKGTLTEEERAGYNEMIADLQNQIAELQSQPGRELTEDEIYSNTVYRIFGQRGMPAFTKATSSDSAKVQYFFDELANADGSARLQRETQESSLAGGLEILNSALSDLKIQIYEAIDEPFKESAEKATGYLNILTESMKTGGFPAVLETLKENALPWADEIITTFADAFGLSEAWSAFKEDPAGVIAQTAVELLLKGGEALTENIGIITQAVGTVTDALFDELETDENKKRLTKIGGDLFDLLVDSALQAPVDIFGIATRLTEIGLETARLTDWESISNMALKGLFHGIGNSLITMLDGSNWAVGFEDIASKIFGIDFSFREWAEYLRDEYNPDDMWGIYEETLNQAAEQHYQKHYAWAEGIGSIGTDVFSEIAADAQSAQPSSPVYRRPYQTENSQTSSQPIEATVHTTVELDGQAFGTAVKQVIINENATSGGW
ncbi:MAG: phage tail tape measure protein [Oscillospiraceae bacterium]|nr:phage tail tape measure protein [Oscillospiraceae bacterium]